MRVLIMAAIFVLAGCTQTTQEISPPLNAMGMSNVSADGWSMFGCGEDRDNVYATRFSATGANGARVTGVVCKGWFKGQTIRFQ